MSVKTKERVERERGKSENVVFFCVCACLYDSCFNYDMRQGFFVREYNLKIKYFLFFNSDACALPIVFSSAH